MSLPGYIIFSLVQFFIRGGECSIYQSTKHEVEQTIEALASRCSFHIITLRGPQRQGSFGAMSFYSGKISHGINKVRAKIPTQISEH